MRSAGCIINDIADKNYDKNVKRTKSRPLASENLEITDAIILFIIFISIGLSILLTLNPICILLGFGRSQALKARILLGFGGSQAIKPRLVYGFWGSQALKPRILSAKTKYFAWCSRLPGAKIMYFTRFCGLKHRKTAVWLHLRHRKHSQTEILEAWRVQHT